MKKRPYEGQNIIIQIASWEESAQAQAKAFAIGYKWLTGNTDITPAAQDRDLCLTAGHLYYNPSLARRESHTTITFLQFIGGYIPNKTKGTWEQIKEENIRPHYYDGFGLAEENLQPKDTKQINILLLLT